MTQHNYRVETDLLPTDTPWVDYDPRTDSLILHLNGTGYVRVTALDKNNCSSLEAVIDRVLVEGDGLCLDDPDDRDCLKGLLLAALAPAFHDDTDTGARLEAEYNHQLVIEERDRLRREMKPVKALVEAAQLAKQYVDDVGEHLPIQLGREPLVSNTLLEALIPFTLDAVADRAAYVKGTKR